MSKLEQLDREQLRRIDRESLIELVLVPQQQFGAQQELIHLIPLRLSSYDDSKKTAPFLLHLLLSGELFRQVGGIIDLLGEEYGASRGKRAPCPPQVQGAGVAVADRFFARGGGVDGVEWEGDFDEFLTSFGLFHSCSSGPGERPRQDVPVGFDDSIGQLAVLKLLAAYGEVSSSYLSQVFGDPFGRESNNHSFVWVPS